MRDLRIEAKRRTWALLLLTSTLGLLALLSCRAETAGKAIRFDTAAQGAIDQGQPVAAFVTTKGWTVELESAYAVLGPVYYYGGAPMARVHPLWRLVGGVAHACATHAQFDYGTVLGEVLEQYVVDLLATNPTSTGEVPGEAGTCQSVELHVHPPGDQQLPAGSPAAAFDRLGGASILLEGLATKDGSQVLFRAALDVPDEGTMRIVQNIAASVELNDASEQPGRLVLQVLVDAWLDQVDFASLGESDTDGRLLFSEGTQARTALLQAVRNRYSYRVTWGQP